MRFRLLFILVTAFFVTMNVLLWRWEYIGTSRILGAIPLEVVWDRLLSAPDYSVLMVEHQGARLGNCTVTPRITQASSPDEFPVDETLAEGVMDNILGYSLDVDFKLLAGEYARLRVSAHLEFSRNQKLEELGVKLIHRPDTWEIRARPAEQRVTVILQEHGAQSERVFSLTNFNDLERLAANAGLPLPPGTLAALGLKPGIASQLSPSSLGIAWRSQNDVLLMGHARMRVLRLDVTALGKYAAKLYVSQIGEVLLVELPGGIVLRNEALAGLKRPQ